MSEKQVKRIIRMEDIADQARQAVDALTAAAEQYRAIQKGLAELESYYSSPAWKEDFQASEEGRLPADLKCGVLAEDTVYDLLSERDELMRELEQLTAEENG